MGKVQTMIPGKLARVDSLGSSKVRIYIGRQFKDVIDNTVFSIISRKIYNIAAYRKYLVSIMSANSLGNLKEAELWQSFKNGDKEAFVLIYKYYFKILANYGSRFTSDAALLEDAVQDLFVSLWRRREQLGNLGHVESPKFYLLRALRNQLMRNARNDIFDQAEDIDDFLDQLVALSSEQLMIDQEHTSDQAQKVKYAISNLSPRQQEAINLRFYHGMSLDQIARIMGINKRAASNMLFKAYTVLRLTLKFISLLITFFSPALRTA